MAAGGAEVFRQADKQGPCALTPPERRAGTASAWVNSGAPPPASIPLAGANAGAWGASSSRVYEEPAPTFGGDDVRARGPPPPRTCAPS